MKTLIFSVLCFIILACDPQCEPIDGKWRVVSPFYKATFQITEDEGSLKCSVLTYDDGTTKYDNQQKSAYYIASNLVCEKEVYVDGLSGATSIIDKGIEIRLLNQDTLAVTSYIMNKPVTEKWIKYGNENK